MIGDINIDNLCFIGISCPQNQNLSTSSIQTRNNLFKQKEIILIMDITWVERAFNL